VYTASGLYTVTLTVTDNSGLTASSTTTANVGTGTPPPPVIDGAALYANLCAGCHGAAPGTKAGRSAAAIQNAINTVPAMNTSAMRALTADEVQAISDAIALTGPQSPVAVPGGPYSGVAGTAVAFNGAGSSDPDGTIAAYNWIFGDGTTGTGATPSHVYTASGLYTVTLTVLDNSGASTTATTTANIGTGTPPPPVIDGAALYATNCAGCHGAAPGTKANRSTAQISSAITNVAAMQTPALQALSAAQVQAIADAIATTGPAPQPPVSVPGGPYTGVVNAAVGFTGGGSYDPDGTIVNYAWNFGDGTTGSGATPSHTYDASGLYTVSLTVTDSSGLTATATSTANIGTSTPPPPVIDGLALYGTYCASCHGAAPGSKANRTAAQIQSAITTVSAMTTPALQALTSTQLAAIAVATTPGGGTPPTPTTGQGLYEMYCLSCHGVAGSGGKVSGKSAGDIQKAIDDEKAMASLRGALSSAQVSAIASYLSGSGGSTGGTIPVGQLLYDTNCLACHDSKGGGGSGGKVSGASSSKISEAISKEKEMTFLKGTLTSTQIKYIADYLAGKSTPLVPAPSPTDGLGLYNTYCAGCHGAAPGTKAGRTSAQIAAAITSVGAMNTTTLRALNSTQVSAIAAAISTGGTPAPMPMPTTGQGLYEMYCLSCHGIRGGGGSGGNIRGDSASKIQEAIDKKKEMAHLRGLFTSDQLKKIADYIKN
jgi:mono/diheme cytochrome c family protein